MCLLRRAYISKLNRNLKKYLGFRYAHIYHLCVATEKCVINTSHLQDVSQKQLVT